MKKITATRIQMLLQLSFRKKDEEKVFLKFYFEFRNKEFFSLFLSGNFGKINEQYILSSKFQKPISRYKKKLLESSTLMFQ